MQCSLACASSCLKHLDRPCISRKCSVSDLYAIEGVANAAARVGPAVQALALKLGAV